MDILLSLTSGAFIFLIGEFIEWVILYNDGAGFHFRFGSVPNHPNLNPIVSTLIVAVIFLVIIIVGGVLSPLFWDYIVSFISSSKDWFLLSILVITFSLLWIWHHIIGKKWNLGQGLLAASSVLLFASYVLINFGYLG